MKNKLIWLYYTFDSIMDLKYNPFRLIGNVSMQYYFMTALSLRWTLAFCSLIAGWAQIIPLIWSHIGILSAIFVTYATFKDAEKDGYIWFQNWNKAYTLSKAYKGKDKTKNACKWDLEKEA